MIGMRNVITSFAFIIAVIGAHAESPIRKAPATAAGMKNPMEGNNQAERAGAKLYARECASCHGLTLEGTRKVPPLVQQEVYEATPGTLFWVLRQGSIRRGMPSFAHLPEAQRWQIVIFLQREGNH
jgi:mono/diheme cytochrome c family protein